MREILLGIAPLVIPTAGSFLVLALIALIGAMCARNPSLRNFLLSMSFAFVVALFVFGCFGVAVTLMTIKEVVAAGGS